MPLEYFTSDYNYTVHVLALGTTTPIGRSNEQKERN
jgi:hypothetical protein